MSPRSNSAACHLLSPSSPVAAAVAFTLVELLVVMAVIVLVIGFVIPAVSGLKGAGDVNKAVYDIAGVLEQSRTHAMSNNTYVYVGFMEADASQSGGTTPQRSGTGRLSIAVVATKDGTQGFSTSQLSSWNGVYPTFANNLSVIGKPLIFDNVHLAADLGTMPTSGGLARPVLSNKRYNLGDTECRSATPFDYPVASNNLGQGKYSFTKVIQFDPQGAARVQVTAYPTTIVPYLEIDLQQTRGTVVPAISSSSKGNVAALQVDGMTGTVHIYRP